MRDVFISASGQHLSGPPVDNDSIERYIGIVSPLATRLGRLVLRQNRIRARHYTMDADRTTTTTSVRMGADAVHNLLTRNRPRSR